MEFTVGEHTYRAERIPARQQFHLVRRLAPFIGEVAPVLAALKGRADDVGVEAVKPLGQALAKMTDEECDYVVFGLLRASKRRIEGGLGWAEVAVGTQLNHSDITMLQMLQIAWGVLRHNLADFMAALPSDLVDKIKTSAA